MATPRSSVCICRDGDTLYCRVEGWGTMNQAPVLRQHAEACLAQGASRLRIDLRHCDYMDSTFLGSLICLSRKFGQRAADGFGLVQPAAACRDLLAKMKLTAVLPVRNTDVPQQTWTELCSERDERGFQRCVVQAHQELASVPGPTGDSFRDLAAALARELEAKTGNTVKH